MSEDPQPYWDRLKDWFRFRLANFANRHCGVPLLYWTNRDEWEAYFGADAQAANGVKE